MKRRNFMKMAGIFAISPAVSGIPYSSAHTSSAKEIYEWRIYTLNDQNDKSLDNFYKETLIPAYNRKKIEVGAFSLFKKGEKEQRYYLFIYPNIATYHKVKKDIWKDQAFCKAAQPFYDTAATTPVYSNFETHLCEAFDKIPKHRTPDSNRSLFEFRIYWSPNEEANQRKITMFNKDEIAIFDEVAINSVCYGEILSGPRMPALIYLTWYKDVESREAAWAKFRVHPDWTRIKNLPEYAHTATNNQSILLSPLTYSQI